MSDYSLLVRKEAKKYPKVPDLEDIGMRVIDAESGGNPTALSPAGAYGRMQLMQKTAEGLGVNRFDPAQNIAGGMRILGENIPKYGLEGALRVYHAGRPDAHNPATDEYVRRVMANRGTAGATRALPVPPEAVKARQSLLNLPPAPGEVTPEELNAYIAGLTPVRNVPTYDPYAQMPNPNYFPTPPFTGAPPQGFDNQRTQPGLGTQRDQLAIQQARDAVTPSETNAAHYKALSDLYKAQGKILELNPPPQMEAEAQTPFPQRGTLPLPDRPDPRLDPVAGIIGAIGGVIDPQAAGHFASAPFEAGMQDAQAEYADRILRYTEAAKQLSMKYEDELASRNDEIRRSRENRGIGYENALSRQKQGVEAGNLGALRDQAIAEEGASHDFIPREKAENINKALVTNINTRISEEEKRNIIEQKQSADDAKNQIALIKSFVAARSRTNADYYKTMVSTLNNAYSVAASQNNTEVMAAIQSQIAILHDERAKAGQDIQSAGQKATAEHYKATEKHNQAMEKAVSTPEERAAQADYAKAADMQSRRASEYSEAVRTKGRGSKEAKSAKEIAEKADKAVDEARQRRDAIVGKGSKGFKKSGKSPSGVNYQIRE